MPPCPLKIYLSLSITYISTSEKGGADTGGATTIEKLDKRQVWISMKSPDLPLLVDLCMWQEGFSLKRPALDKRVPPMYLHFRSMPK
jgi:hypothetical protein